MIVFSEPRGAVEWAVLLQLALFRYCSKLHAHNMKFVQFASLTQSKFKPLEAVKYMRSQHARIARESCFQVVVKLTSDCAFVYESYDK